MQNYDFISDESRSKLERKLSLTERIYADIEEKMRLEEGKKWREISKKHAESMKL